MDSKQRMNRCFFVLLAASALAWGCDGDPAPTDSGMQTDGGNDPGTDGGEGTDGGGTASTDCERYCDAVGASCTGDNAQYDDRDDCLSYCTAAGWPVGTEGETSGNTIECRIYHAGAAAGDPATHCPHAGASGADVCGSVDFRSDEPTAYTRVDRMGMPAVSTALITGDDRKEAYNDASPADDITLAFAGDIIGTLTAVHDALDDDLTGAGLTPCSMSTTSETIDPDGGGPLPAVPECVGQDYAPGAFVGSLVLPDTLRIDPAVGAGFPNGRGLADPVIDVTLAVILLEMGGTCGTEGVACSPVTLLDLNPDPAVDAPLNPAANDVAFSTEFPYLAAPHTP